MARSLLSASGMKRLTIFPSSLLLALGACTGGTGGAEPDTTATGQARYRDAETDAGGQPREAAEPPRQPENDPMLVEITVEGTGELSGLDPECSLDGASGAFEGYFMGEGSVSEDGVYAAGLASSEALFETPSGCTIPDLEISAVSEVVVRGSLSATAKNCDTYCEAKARAYGESECGAGAGSAECRGAAETDYSASCETSCTAQTTYAIVAETRLSAAATAELTAESLTGAALGELTADLEFDHMETSSGDTVSEAP